MATFSGLFDFCSPCLPRDRLTGTPLLATAVGRQQIEAMDLSLKIRQLKEVGLKESDKSLERLLEHNKNDVESSLNAYYETGIPKIPKLAFAKVAQTSSSMIVSNSKSSSSSKSRNDLQKEANDRYIFIGRRSCEESYTLDDCYALRQQSLRFNLEGKAPSNMTGPRTKTKNSFVGNRLDVMAAGNFSSKEKFSAGKLLFETYLDTNEVLGSEKQQNKTCQGRLPNWLCDFLVPLLQEKIVELRGHVSFDRGYIKRFDYIPISMHIYIATSVLNRFSEGRKVLVKEETYLSDFMAQNLNDLFVFLQEGKDGVTALQKQRVKDNSFHKEKSKHINDKAASLSSNNATVDTNEKNSTSDHYNNKSIEEASEVELSIDEIAADESMSVNTLPLALQPKLICDDITMKPYQLQALHWMLQREKNIDSLSSSSDGISLDLIMVRKLVHEGFIHMCAKDASCSSPLWQPILGVSSSFITSYSPQEVQTAVHEAPQSALNIFYWNRYSHKVQLKVPPLPLPCRGGLLADDMGMGKTLMSLALIASDLEVSDDDRLIFSTQNNRKKRRYNDGVDGDNDIGEGDIDADYGTQSKTRSSICPTLIVAPMSLINQWVNEAKSKYKASAKISIFMYYGNQRYLSSMSSGTQGYDSYSQSSDVKRSSLNSHDIVITSYGVVVSEAKHLKDPCKADFSDDVSSIDDIDDIILNKAKGLFGVTWHRIILDEAHTIKNPQTEAAKAVTLLRGTCRWALTGTPIQNSLSDVFSLIKFLKHQPWDSIRWWKKTIQEPQEKGDPRGVLVLRTLLSEIMLRRTKFMRDESGNMIVQLPPRVVVVEFVELDEAEREFYDAIVARSKDVFKGFSSNSLQTRHKYAFLFSLVMRMRQTCDHPYLVMSKLFQTQKDDINSSSNDMVHSLLGDAPENIEGISTEGLLVVREDDENSKEDERTSALFGNEFLSNIYLKLRRSVSSRQMHDEGVPYEGSDIFVRGVLQNLASMATDSADSQQEKDCPICFEVTDISNSSLLPCGHLLCTICARSSISKFRNCPLCQKDCSIDDLIVLKPTMLIDSGSALAIAPAAVIVANSRSSLKGAWEKCGFDLSLERGGRKEIDMNKKTGKSFFMKEGKEHIKLKDGASNIIVDSAKIRAILKRLEEVFSRNEQAHKKPLKVVIFSQWTSMLDLIEKALIGKHVFKRLDGSMSQEKRAESIHAFHFDRSVRVLLISLRAGGVGLNLTCASIIIMTDPWWNYAVEDQAMDRVHRLGQLRDVEVYRLIVKNSVEERLLVLQEKKRSLSLQVIGEGGIQLKSEQKHSLEDLLSLFT